MSFAELGVAPELIRAVEDLGWTLPTPVQAEAVPLILGGGDVMAAAETGSGKTGAFALPIIQTVHETLVRASQRAAANSAALDGKADDPGSCRLNAEDRDAVVAISPDGLVCQARSQDAWGGCRATVGAFAGKLYYEMAVQDEGLCRIGWATLNASLDVGTDRASFGYGGTGKRSHAKQFETYGATFGLHDVIGCWLDCDSGEIGFAKNGENLGVAFTLPPSLRGQALFPAMCLKNAELRVNFGGKPFAFAPPEGFMPFASATREGTATWQAAQAAAVAAAGAIRRPSAIILEPARDLAEQTHHNVALFARHLSNPDIRSQLLVGGTSTAEQVKSLKSGVDVVVGTPGRVMDLLERGDLTVDSVKFFVLDEADRLLDTGNRASILQLFKRLPKAGAGTSRLQVLLFSATLHSEEVRTLAKEICQDPVLIDLKGREFVPESVDHLVVHVDAREDKTWLQSEPAVWTDNVHALHPPLSATSSDPEAFSEATKRLKPRLLQRLVDSLNMEQALIFCRTNYDCDNLQRFLNSLGTVSAPETADGTLSKKRKLGGGGNGSAAAYSCMVLAGQRTLEERRAALRAFKEGEVRFLIATDVAARGIDIQGLPFVVNMTLPDRSEDYVHRIGRVGRADAIGLAVSLVSEVPEKVWFCTQKGLKPWLSPDDDNTRTTDQGGHTIWYDEPRLLKEVEERLGKPVTALPPDLTLPPEVAAKVAGGGDGAKYGEARNGDAAFAKEVAARAAAAQPAVRELAALEHEAQISFFEMKKRWAVTAMPQ